MAWHIRTLKVLNYAQHYFQAPHRRRIGRLGSALVLGHDPC